MLMHMRVPWVANRPTCNIKEPNEGPATSRSPQVFNQGSYQGQINYTYAGVEEAESEAQWEGG
jgi:hypothetical protein